MVAPAAIAVPVVDGAGVAVLVGVVLSTRVTSSASALSSSELGISSSVPPLSPAHGAPALRPSAVLFPTEVGPAVCVVHSVGSLLLLSRASLVASAIFVHLLLNAMWFPMNLGHFSCIWPQREPCIALHPTTLHKWVLVRFGPKQ
jgi:hypothetical protein